MKKSTLASCIAVLALCSCTTIQHTTTSEEVDTQVHNLTVADVNVSKERVSHTYNWNWDPLSTISLSDKKKSAAAELLNEQGGDVLVEPQYVVKRRGVFRGGEITVSGYPATYRNFRSMTQSDADIIATIDPKTEDSKSPLAFVTNIFKPSDGKKAAKPKKRRTPGFRLDHQFVNLLGGPVFDNNNDNIFGSVGLMWGKTGDSWGYYVKGMLIGNDDDKLTGALTVGALKRVSNTVNIFFGTGIGGNHTRATYESHSYYYYHRSRNERVCALPVDLGAQWRIKRVNLLLGLTGSFRLKRETDNRWYNHFVTFTPEIGVGYCF